jgi:uncharacterized protein (TIGR02231 family)
MAGLLLMATPAFAAAPTPLTASARITAVTLYPDGALTTRTTNLTLQTGSYLITFADLPTLLADDSIRVAGKGSATATIVGLEVKKLFLAESGEKRVEELEREIRLLEQRSGALDARQAGLTSQGLFIDSIRVAWGERISQELAIGRPTATELQDAVNFVGTGVSKITEQTFDIVVEKEEISRKIDALRRQRDEATASGRKESKRVEVIVEVARAGTLTLELEGLISRAGWVPTYDARLADDGKSVVLTFRALLRQQTGEDWNNVDLTLSTARPGSGGAPPELSPWYLALLRPQPPQVKAQLYQSAVPAGRMKAGNYEEMVLAADTMAAEEPVLVEMAELREGETFVSFHLPRSVDLPADGTQQSSVVASADLPVDMEFLAIPKLSPRVFRKAAIVNQGAYLLLPGKINTFAGNTYTGSSLLPKVAAGEKFDLFFGSDDQVTIKREELKQRKEAGLFGSHRVTYRYRLELNNFRPEPVTLLLRDQLPLAADEEIKISLLDPSLLPEESGSDGRLTWRIPVKGGEKKELTFGIQVEYPKDREISGL